MRFKSLFCMAMALCFMVTEAHAREEKTQALSEEQPINQIDGLRQSVDNLKLAVDGFAQTVDSLKQAVDSFRQMADSPKVAVDDPLPVSRQDSRDERCAVLVDSLRQKHQADSLKMAKDVADAASASIAKILNERENANG